MPTEKNYKSIAVVPTASDFIDIVLSRTQRRTPTVVHKGWKITRIRSFYMRKVKFTQQNINQKLQQILDDFPILEQSHPFYSELINVLYDKDHYKLALGRLNLAKGLIVKLAQDYVRLLKYGDSLYRCKELKRAALGRMCTIMKKHSASLAYLEQVRQHLSRLPSIDPYARTILLCGYPNVGKSSLINTLTRADVEVQPYAFTTKALYVGHMDHSYLRWQVIDTPGVLDKPLEDRNAIEMQSIAALVHLTATVIYLVDLSGQCGYTLQQQADLFHSIKPVFAGKPVIIGCNKSDVRGPDTLTPDESALLKQMALQAAKDTWGADVAESECDKCVMWLSTLKQEGVSEIKGAACERLLAKRVERKMASKKVESVANRIHVSLPIPRDQKSRPSVVPASVLAEKSGQQPKTKIITERDLQEEGGGAGVYSSDDRKRWLLEQEGWRYDVQPEIYEGHNVADFIDPEIAEKLDAIEREEEEMMRQYESIAAEMDTSDFDTDTEELIEQIREKRASVIAEHRRKKKLGQNQAPMPAKYDVRGQKTVEAMTKALEGYGMDSRGAVASVREQSRSRSMSRPRAREKKREREMGEGAMDVDMEGQAPTKRIRSSRSRSMARGPVESLAAPKARDGLSDALQRNKAIKMADKAQFRRNKLAKASDSDRRILNSMPKHLFSGKRGIGKTGRR